MSDQAIKQAIIISADLCKHFEGFYSKPYLCPAGYWTIGYGTVYKPDGSRVTQAHPPITRTTAEQWLLYELEHNYMVSVLSRTPNVIKYPKILAALTDFAYNLGGARYRASTLARRVQEERWPEAVQELLRWNRGGGKVLPGLVRRRQAEAKLFPHV